MLATLKLANIFKNKEKALNDIKKLQFLRYYRQAQKIKNNENAKIIQKFIKEKLRKYFNKKDLIKKGANLFNTFLRKKVFQNLKDKAKDNYTKLILTKRISKQKDVNNKILSEALNKWRNIIPLLKQNEAANKIIYLLRANKSKNIKNNL